VTTNNNNNNNNKLCYQGAQCKRSKCRFQHPVVYQAPVYAMNPPPPQMPPATNPLSSQVPAPMGPYPPRMSPPMIPGPPQMLSIMPPPPPSGSPTTPSIATHAQKQNRGAFYDILRAMSTVGGSRGCFKNYTGKQCLRKPCPYPVHGKSNQNASACPHLTTGCATFFSATGCPFSHSVYLN
jgi:hypothetical protein